MNVGGVLIAGQRVADEHRIGSRRIECAVGLVGDLKRRELDAGIELERLIRTKPRNLRMRILRLAEAVSQIRF